METDYDKDLDDWISDDYKIDKDGNLIYTEEKKILAPLSWANIPPKTHVEIPLPPIEPKGWWETCWFNPFRKEDEWLSNVRPV